MRWRLCRALAAAVFLLPSAGCGGHTSSSPAAPSTTVPPAVATASVTGRALDVFSAAPQPAVTVRLQSGAVATTSGDGTFALAATAGEYLTSFSGTGIVTRQTSLRVPGPDALVSLIPATFDLGSFDQMCRVGDGRLQRWDTAPNLIVIDAVLQFTSVNDSTYVATAERLSAEEREGIVADLAWGLPQVTGDTFRAFNSVAVESPAAGAQVSFYSREGMIVVARFLGLQAGTTYWGYGRWATRSNVVVAGCVMIDRGFDAAAGPYRRSLRVHEMGHALGYGHVLASSRSSFMNNSGIVEPNAFDRDASRLAFQRPPGNQSPDVDPFAFRANFRSFPMVWGPITP
jgi:hypothetical protein